MDVYLASLSFSIINQFWLVIYGDPRSPEATYTYIFKNLEKNGVEDWRCLKYVDRGHFRSLTRSLLKLTTPVKFATVEADQRHRVQEMLERSRISLMNRDVDWPVTFAEYLYLNDVVEDDVEPRILKRVCASIMPGGEPPVGLTKVMMEALRDDLRETER
ncbi:hypothetical protein BDV06DRAFT_190512 [Aspergillus oleicola]